MMATISCSVFEFESEKCRKQSGERGGGWMVGEKGECGKHTLWQHTHRDGIVGGGLGVLGDQI